MKPRLLFSFFILLGFCTIAFAYTEKDDGIRSFDRKKYVLSNADYKRISEQVRNRCNIPQLDLHSYPWYYHYELGMEMKKKNDWQRALDSFLDALDRRQKPARLARTYGVWFINYHPYYEIAVAHYHLGNWSCAVKAFQLSEQLETLPAKSREIQQLQSLKSDAVRHLQTNPD